MQRWRSCLRQWHSWYRLRCCTLQTAAAAAAAAAMRQAQHVTPTFSLQGSLTACWASVPSALSAPLQVTTGAPEHNTPAMLHLHKSRYALNSRQLGVVGQHHADGASPYTGAPEQIGGASLAESQAAILFTEEHRATSIWCIACVSAIQFTAWATWYVASLPLVTRRVLHHPNVQFFVFARCSAMCITGLCFLDSCAFYVFNCTTSISHTYMLPRLFLHVIVLFMDASPTGSVAGRAAAQRAFMEHSWSIHGAFMEHSWSIHGAFMEHSWSIR
jgi:hypothetical protein